MNSQSRRERQTPAPTSTVALCVCVLYKVCNHCNCVFALMFASYCSNIYVLSASMMFILLFKPQAEVSVYRLLV